MSQSGLSKITQRAAEWRAIRSSHEGFPPGAHPGLRWPVTALR